MKADPRKASRSQRTRHRMIAQWRGVQDGPLIDLPVAPLAGLLAAVLKDLKLEDRAILDEVLAAWKDAAGEFIARHSAPVSVAKGVLTVRVTQSSVRHAVTMDKPMLLKRVNAKLESVTLTDLRFTHG